MAISVTYQLLEAEIELKEKYEEFLKTDDGREWKHLWQSRLGSDIAGDFGDYLYDFYPEMLPS